MTIHGVFEITSSAMFMTQKQQLLGMMRGKVRISQGGKSTSGEAAHAIYPSMRDGIRQVSSQGPRKSSLAVSAPWGDLWLLQPRKLNHIVGLSSCFIATTTVSTDSLTVNIHVTHG
jgi:hypothetical protein